MNLVIDFGNTAGKAAIFDQDKLIEVFKPIQISEVAAIEAKYKPEKCIISSSSIAPSEISQLLNVHTFILSHRAKLPFNLTYKTPETLGLDRIAGVAGGAFDFPNTNLLVIDLGTCITYDVLIGGNYLGGGISPGLNMRFKGLNTFTANLPLVEFESNVALVGDSTKHAMQSGVIHGMASEIEGIISKYQDKFGEIKVLLCGGDYIYFEKMLKASIFAAPELVLKGLNGILRYNVS